MAVTRIPVLGIRPQVEGGRFPVKAVVGEQFEVRAQVFGEGSASVGAAVVVAGPDQEVRSRVPMTRVDGDLWAASIVGTDVGAWTFRIESWHDPVATWQRDAHLKIVVGVDVEVTLAEGALLLDRMRLHDDSILDASLPPLERLNHAITLFDGEPIHDHLDATEPYPFHVDRERALFGSWYEMFPRSEGALDAGDGSITPGTLRTAAVRLDDIAAMGFDVVYLPPIHPIGTQGRKGRNNSLTALPGDPGSPWAIGSRAGGHDTVHPDLGTIDDFDAFVARANDLGLEVALDLALQCSPDHPWVAEHPEWFTTRPDGSFAVAEDPPRQYLDIYALTFDEDPAGLYDEVRRILEHWIQHGVRIFRADDSHTKPTAFWEHLLADLRQQHPDVIVLSDAITTPATTRALAMIGFHQSYTHFAEREHPAEIASFLTEISSGSSDFLRPNLWVNTHDLLPTYLQSGDPAMFRMRAGLAATASPAWGMYAGYELRERLAVGRTQEYSASEKFEIKVRDWDADESIAPYITQLNQIRRAHPALRRLRNLTLVSTDHHRVVAFTKIRDDDVVLVIVDARPWFEDTVQVHLDQAGLGLSPDTIWHDELGDIKCQLDEVPIGPDHPVRILIPVPLTTDTVEP